MRRLRLFLSIAITFLTTRIGLGQTIFHHPVSPTEITSFKAKLHLDADQATSMDLLYEADAANFRLESVALRELKARFDKAFEKELPDEERSPEDLQLAIEFGKALQKFRVARMELARTTLRDFEHLLTEEQKEKYWPGVMRDYRRNLLHRTHIRGMVAWGNMDLVKLTKSLEIDPQDRAVITPIMEQYVLDMDKILQPFEQASWNNPTQRGDDYEKAAVLAGRQAEALNRKYCRFMTDMLSPAAKEKLLGAAYKEAYFEIYGLTNDDAAMMPRILELPDLTAAQVEALTVLNTKWNSDLHEFYRRSQDTYDRAAIATQAMTTEEYFERLQNPLDPLIHPFKSGITENFAAITNPYGENLRRILTPEQQAVIWPPSPKVELDPKTVETAKQRQR